MRKGHFLKLITFFLAVFVIGCGEKTQDQSATISHAPETKETATLKKSFDASESAMIVGKVFFDGDAPQREKLPIQGNPECSIFHPGASVLSEELIAEDGLLQNAFIYVKEGLEGYTFETPTTPAVIDNRRCVYVPHIIGVQTNQPVQIVNSDPTLHNIHSYAKNSKSWNLGLPFQGMKQIKKFPAEEIMVMLKCDVHPWMSSYIAVMTHPYFAVTGTDGQFKIDNLPAGKYTIEAWHEKLGTQTSDITIGSGDVNAAFSFKIPK